MFFTLNHLLRFGLPRPSAISKITSEAGEILRMPNTGQIRPGFKASFIVWNGDPFSISSYPILVIGEGKVAFKDIFYLFLSKKNHKSKIPFKIFT